MNSKLVGEGLQKRRQELESRVERIDCDLRHPVTPVEGGFADQVADRANNDVLRAIREAAKVELLQISGAVRRLAEGRYQICEKCGGLISEDRLEAAPCANTCGGCDA
jgi:RNA polymerase-binding transcription factor DksA